jgi:hypothetical protein
VIPTAQVSSLACSTLRIVCEVPSIGASYCESVECFPGLVSKFFFKLFVTVPVAPVVSGIITHFICHVRCTIIIIIIIIIFLLLLLAIWLLIQHINKQVLNVIIIIIIIITILITIGIFVIRGVHIFPKKRNIKIQGAARVTCCKFHTEDPQIFGATVQNVFASGELAPGICAPLIIVIRSVGL